MPVQTEYPQPASGITIPFDTVTGTKGEVIAVYIANPDGVNTNPNSATHPVDVSSADGAQATIGTTTDASSANTVVGLLKRFFSIFPALLGRTTMAGSLSVTMALDQGNVPVSIEAVAGTLPVSGTVTANAGSGTQAVSLASIPLSTLAATSAKQPALGTAGTPSADVVSVQGIAGGTGLPVSGNVGGYSTAVVVTPALVITSAYAAGNLMDAPGHPVTNAFRTGEDTGYLTTVVVSDLSNQKAAFDLNFFSVAPTTGADHTNYDPTAAEMLNYLGTVSILATDYTAPFVTKCGATKTNVGLEIKAGTTTIYVSIVNRQAATYATNSALQITLGFAQD